MNQKRNSNFLGDENAAMVEEAAATQHVLYSELTETNTQLGSVSLLHIFHKARASWSTDSGGKCVHNQQENQLSQV